MNIICFDIETNGTDFLKPEIVGFAFKLTEESGDYETGYLNGKYINAIRGQLEGVQHLKICHNLKFEYNYLKSLGIIMQPPFYDTQIAAQLCNMYIEKHNPTTRKTTYTYGLKRLAEKYLGYHNMITFKDLTKQYGTPAGTNKDGSPSKRTIPAMSKDIPEDVLAEYCKQDVSMTYKLYEVTYKKLRENPKLWDLFTLVKMPLIPIYADMERAGVKIDVEHLTKQAEILKTQIDDIERQMEEYI